MKISEVLIKARDIIQERGWRQGGYHGPNGEVCLETALGEAIGGLAVFDPSGVNRAPAGRVLSQYLGLDKAVHACPCPCKGMVRDSLAWWNDTAGRTVEEVIEALEVCALIEAEKEAAAPPQPEVAATVVDKTQPYQGFQRITLSATGDLPIDAFTGAMWTVPKFKVEELVSV